jgi:hypothetical protein
MKFITTTLYILLLLGQVVTCYLKPLYNWDMLGYMGCAISIETKNVDSIHAKTFRSAQSELNKNDFQKLTQSNKFVQGSFVDPHFFYNRLKFYWVKPLFVILVFLFYKIGLSLTISTITPSLFSLFGIGVLLLYWTRKYLNAISGTIISGLIILSPPFWEIGRLSTPDALAAFVVLLAFYFVLEKTNPTATITLLILSVLIRIDLALLAIIMIAFLYFSKNINIQINRKTALLSFLIVLILVVSLSIIAGSFGSPNYNFVWKYDGLGIIYFSKLTWLLPQLFHSYFILFFGIILLGLLFNPVLKNPRFQLSCQVALILIIYMLIHLLLLLNLDDRFFIAEYVIISMITAMSLKRNMNLLKG